jgi:hypothetical protein
MACELWYRGDGAHRTAGGSIEHMAVGGYLMNWTDGQPLPTVEGTDPAPGAYAGYTVEGAGFYGTQFYSRPTVYLAVAVMAVLAALVALVALVATINRVTV